MLANHKGEIPFLVLLLPFLLGISIGLCFSSAIWLYWILAPLLFLSIAFIVLNLNYTRFALYRIRWIGGLLMTLILFLAGWFSVIRYNELNSADHFSKASAQHLLVKINNEPTVKNGLTRFTALVEQRVNSGKPVKASGSIIVTLMDTTTKFFYGDELLIPAKYNIVDPPFNPAEFNYKKYLAHQNIYHQAFLFAKQYVVINHNSGNPIIAYSLKLRHRLIEKFKRNMHDTSAIAVASTLILGYKADLSTELLQAYSKTGTIHILSVSGGHVAIIYLLLNVVFGFLGRYKKGKLIKALVIILLIWGYTMLTGFSPPACRAAIMISLIIIGKSYSRYINTLNILAASAFFLLLYDPYFIVDVGFQLSYLAVAGLVVLQPYIYKWLKFKNKWVDKLWAACSVSIAAQMITFPLSAFYFHQFPVYFLISNLFILLPAEFILCVGSVYLVLPQIPYVSAILGWILERSILLMNKILLVIEQAPLASIGKIWLTSFEYILIYMVIICLFYFLFDTKKWLIKLSLGLLLIVGTSISIKRIHVLNSDSIAFLNLRKHQGLVFKHGDKAIILTDIALSDKNYQYSIQPYLDSSKVADTTVYSLDRNINSPFLKKIGNLIQFQNKRVLLVDQSIQTKQLFRKIKVDYLYLTNNPNVAVYELNKNYDYAILLIGAGNQDKNIDEWEKQARYLHVNYQTIKRNNSFIALSN
ncbi:MAG: ComEC/Rec2 family competence protein [Bacteroidota bacterium]